MKRSPLLRQIRKPSPWHLDTKTSNGITVVTVDAAAPSPHASMYPTGSLLVVTSGEAGALWVRRHCRGLHVDYWTEATPNHLRPSEFTALTEVSRQLPALREWLDS